MAAGKFSLFSSCLLNKKKHQFKGTPAWKLKAQSSKKISLNLILVATMVAKARDSRRLSEAAKYAANKEERKRKLNEKNRAEIAANRQFGDDYQPCML